MRKNLTFFGKKLFTMDGTSSCPVCGCSEVFKDSGFFYCQDCQTQREGIRVFEAGFVEEKDAENEVEQITSQVLGRKTKKQRSADRKGEDFTSWEMFNFVLRGQVDELVALGAPPSIKMTVLQLWAYYLKRKGVAFFSKEKTVLPKANKTLLRRDAKLIFGASEKKPNSKKINKTQIKKMNASISESQDWSAMKLKKKIHSQMKKAVMSKISEFSVAGNPECTSCILDEANVLNDTINVYDDVINTQDVLEREYRPLCADAQLSSEEKAKDSSEMAFKRFGWNMNRITRQGLILFLYLALLYEGSDICLSDLIRWIREGHLSYFHVGHFLPENAFVEGLAMNQLRIVCDIPSYESLRNRSADFARYLGMVYWPIPNWSTIAKKYLNELNLPVIFCDYIQQLIKLAPDLFYGKNSIDIPSYEGRVLAVLMIIMKIMFGLDGKTEHKVSKAAAKLNVWLSHKKSKHRRKLFVWNNWVKRLICRNAVLSEHNIHIKHVISPETMGNTSLLINYFKKMEEDHKKTRHKYQYKKTYLTDTHPELMNFFNQVLEKLDNPEVMKNDVDFPACTTPHYLYTSKILEKSLEVDNLITDKAREILSEDFSDSDVSYLFSPFSMRKLVEKNGHHLTISTSAQKRFRVYRCCPIKRARKFYKGKCFVAVTQCRRLSILDSRGRKRKPTDRSFVDHQEEEQEEYSHLNELVNKALEVLNVRKRKTPNVKHNPKKRKQENEHTKHKTLDLNFPHQQYWVLHDDWCTDEKKFESQIFVKFPFAFAWLLSECALLSEMKKFDLYNELVFIEKYYKKHVLPNLLPCS